jgi:hypothetical protein
MTNFDVLSTHKLRIDELLRLAEQDRLARLVYRQPRPVRRRVGQLLIATGQLLIDQPCQPSYNAYEEALAIADRVR